MNTEIDIIEVIEQTQDLTLLYVEDNAEAREMTLMILEDFFENIVVAVDGEDGLNKFFENDIDLVLTDINMPKLSGLQMSEKIRQKDKETPLLVLSAHNEDNFFIDSIKIGIDGYLLKPVDIDELSKLFFRVIQKFKFAKESKENHFLLKEYQEATNNSSIVSKFDLDGNITYVNDKLCTISGYSKEELIGKKHYTLQHRDNPSLIFDEMLRTVKEDKKIWQGVVRHQDKMGKSYYVDSTVMPILDTQQNIIEIIALKNDITEVMNPEKQFFNALEDHKTPLVIYMKLEKYDMLEDFYDNETIRQIQESAYFYLQDTMHQELDFDTFYHLPNGEYALIMNYHDEADDIDAFITKVQRIQTQIKEAKISLEDIEYDIVVDIALAFEKEKIYESLKIAFRKMVQHNQNFMIANKLAVSEQIAAKKNLQTIHRIKDAILNSRIVSYFQPIVDNQTGEIVKMESLVRLISKEGEIIAPFHFLDTAKKSYYYHPITHIVLKNSFDTLLKCPYDISINLSSLDIENRETREYILTFLEQHPQDASRIVFELLEDEQVRDFQTVQTFIEACKGYGVQIAIDDFGTGYSNYERLLSYQPDILKIDGCLIRNIETSDFSLSAVKSIVTFAKEQGLATVAEFIENEAIFEIVKALGVDYSQGYYFGKPATYQNQKESVCS